MKELRRFKRTSDARIILMKGRFRLSHRACVILGITPLSPCIKFYEDEGRIYISNCESPDGYWARQRGATAEFNSVPMSRYLADLMQGYGIYRIMEESYTFYNGRICYEIYPIPYEN